MVRVELAGLCLVVAIVLTSAGCLGGESQETVPVDRERFLPPDAVKIGPATDQYPPIVRSIEYLTPAALPSPINTAGAEDSAYIMADGSTLYFWFTPDAGIPAEKQLSDGATGIYVSQTSGTGWSAPARIVVQAPGKLALDGCPFVQDDTMWFCSAREGYTGMNLFTAESKDGRWSVGTYTGDLLNRQYQVGEMHISADGKQLYFHSARPGGEGGLDIWVSRSQGGSWLEPEPVTAVNTEGDEGWPFVTEDGRELWFTRTYQGAPAIFRSAMADGRWQTPELVVERFAAEPSVDREGTLYFTHHFVVDGRVIEADIYSARRAA
jgi:ribosomal protein L24E